MNPLFCGTYSELQARFIADVSAMRKLDPLAPLDVLVTGQLVRLSLRRELARAGCSHANVRFLTPHDLAREISQPQARKKKLKPLSDVTRGPLMLRAVELAGPLRYFGELSAREGFRSAARRTIDELRGAGVTAENLRTAADKLRSSRSEILQKKLLDLAAIWSALDRLMGEHGYADAITLLELACESDDFGDSPLIIYGFDELTHVEMRFVNALIRKRPVSVYLPYRDQPAFVWVKPLYDFFTAEGFTAVAAESASSHVPTILERVQHDLFSDESPPEHPPSPEDSGILILSAPARDREAEEIAREVLYSPLAETHPRRSIGILLRESDPYIPLLRQEFAQAGIEGYFHHCLTLGETSAGRAFRLLSALLDEKYRRADVMEFLLSSPVKWPAELGDLPSSPPAALWNQFSLLAGITFGEKAWTEGLRRLTNQFLLQRDRAEETDEDLAFHAEQIVHLKNLQCFMIALFARVQEINSSATWREKTLALWSLFSDLVETDETCAALQDELARADELDGLGVLPRGENFSSFIGTTLATPAAREGRFQVHEPTVATFREAQGVIFDEVFIPGIVEKEIPRSYHQDPLFSDEDREQLENLIGGRPKPQIPRRNRLRERELFSFHCAAGSAKRRAVFSFPRRESSANRDRLPSTYLLKIVEAATGRFTDYAAFDKYIAESRSARSLPAGRLRANGIPRAATVFQFHIARLSEAIRAGSIRPATDLLRRHPFFARGLTAETQRFRENEFTRFDGLLERKDVLADLATLFIAKPFSPTRMETYATCPFRYFAQHLLDLSPVEEPLEIAPFSPLARGSLVHSILEKFYRAETASAPAPLQPGAEKRLKAAAEKEFAKFARESVTGPALLWRIEQQNILNILLSYIEREIETSARLIPKYIEHPFEFTWKGDPPLVFRGKMDRVDLSPEGFIVIWDYKTGSSKTGLKDGSLLGGRALQLPVYRLAAEAEFQYAAERASYCYLADVSKKQVISYTNEHWQDGREIFTRVIHTITDGVKNGRFYPLPESSRACETCPVKAACGSGRFSHKTETAQTSTAGFRAMREECS